MFRLIERGCNMDIQSWKDALADIEAADRDTFAKLSLVRFASFTGTCINLEVDTDDLQNWVIEKTNLIGQYLIPHFGNGLSELNVERRTGIDAEQAWQSALGQLQMEMPKASFDTWVRDTQLVSYENGLFVIGVRNTYAREWLESRLSSSVTRLLMGIMNRSVDVRFIVHGGIQTGLDTDSFLRVRDTWNKVLEKLSEKDLPDEAVSILKKGTLDGQNLDACVLTVCIPKEDHETLFISPENSQVVDWATDLLRAELDDTRIKISLERTDEKDLEETGDEIVELRAEEYDDAYEGVAHPGRAVVLPGYFRYWLRLLGPTLAWLYVAFRQTAYGAGGRSGKQYGRFSGSQIAANGGFCARSFWRRVKKDETWAKLTSLVTSETSTKEWRPGNKPRRLMRRYSVAMTLPLTPDHTYALNAWLKEKAGEVGPEAALRTAADTPVDELLTAKKGEGRPQTVRQIVAGLFGDRLAAGQVSALATAIQSRIMPPKKDTIHIPLYFLENVLPYMGPGPGWMLTVLRDMSFVNRNLVTVAGGYREVADWMGMSRPMTVYEWLHGKKAGKFKHPVIRVYVREVAERRAASDFENAPRTFDVYQDDIPHEVLEMALTDQDLNDLFTRLSQDIYANVTIGFTRLSEDNYATVTSEFTRFAQVIYASVRVFNLLTSQDQSLKPENKNLQPPGSFFSTKRIAAKIEPGKIGAGVGGSSWDFNKILELNRVKPDLRSTFTDSCDPRSFVSWILYAYGPEGQGVNDATALAVARLSQKPGEGAGGAYDHLAEQAPQELYNMLQQAIRGGYVDNYHFQRAFSKLRSEALQELSERLFGK
jgi:hypothetical protein